MAIQSTARLIDPVAVRFNEALVIAAVGLAVNVACAWILRERPQAHGHPHDAHAAHHHDHNLAAAYLHVLADALTSLLAIAALLGGKIFGWVALDAAMGLVGAVVIAHWSFGLMRRSGRVLLDAEDTGPLVDRVRMLLEANPRTHVADLHVWRIGMNAYACIATIVTHADLSADAFKHMLAQIPEIRHVTVEVNHTGGTG
jgi:cation diffusion facilitator family transporter